MTQFFVFVLL